MLRRSRRTGRTLRPCAALARHPPRRAHPHLPHRHDRLADRFPRRDQGRRGRRAGQHPADRGRLPVHARLTAGRGCLVVSEELYPRFAKAIARRQGSRPRRCVGRQRARPRALRRCAGRRQSRRRYRADHARRHVLLALHVGLDRQAQGRRAYARRSQAHRRSLRQADPRHRRKRYLLFGGEAVLRLWARQRADFSACRPAPRPCCCRHGRRRMPWPSF